MNSLDDALEFWTWVFSHDAVRKLPRDEEGYWILLHYKQVLFLEDAWKTKIARTGEEQPEPKDTVLAWIPAVAVEA